MIKKGLTLLAAVFALCMTFGATSTASARVPYPSAGCCGPLKPTYVNSNVYKHITKIRHRNIEYTTRFPQYHHIYYVRHVHVVTNIHTITHVHHHRVGYRVDVPSSKVVFTNKVYYTNKTYTTTDCRCVGGSSHCR